MSGWSELERWAPIDLFGSYQVSNWGRVRSHSKHAAQHHPNFAWGGSEHRILKTDTTPRGHHKVTLYGPDGAEVRMVHLLVLEAFVGPKPSAKHLGLHRNDDKDDNRAPNLYWGTRKQNAADARRNGRMAVGKRNGKAVLDAALVKAARLLAEHGKTCKEIAGYFGVSKSAISNAVAGRTWSHVQ